MKVTLIIPMYNESSIINGAIDTFYGYMKEHFSDWELIFVDDGSVDGCGKAVEAKSADDSRVRLISYTPNMGKGCAVRTGMLASTGDIVIFTDCDNAYGTDVIEKMVKQFEESDRIQIFRFAVRFQRLSRRGSKKNFPQLRGKPFRL